MTTMSRHHRLADPRSGLSTLTRPRFSQGQMLHDDDLSLAVEHPRDLQRLLMRSLLGCGVICGFEVGATETDCKVIVTVAAGVALDPAGQAIQMPTAQTLVIDTTCCDPPQQFYVAIRHQERSCLPRAAGCEADSSGTVNTRINEGYEIQLFPELPDGGCNCNVPSSQIKALTDAGAFVLTQPAAKPTGKGSKAASKSAAAKAITANETTTTGAAGSATDCPCSSMGLDGYQGHYAGACGCSGEGKWVVLAWVLAAPRKVGETTIKGLQAQDHIWLVDHSVRRFVRPLLMKDPRSEMNGGSGS